MLRSSVYALSVMIIVVMLVVRPPKMERRINADAARLLYRFLL
jgi:hypothetical protein